MHRCHRDGHFANMLSQSNLQYKNVNYICLSWINCTEKDISVALLHVFSLS